MRPRVFILSPLRGDTADDRTDNELYLDLCVKDALARGEAPFAGHGFYTLYLDDDDADDRALGMACGRAWMEAADIVAVYVDRGISQGMHDDLRAIDEHAMPVPRIEYRELNRAA